MVGRAGSDTGSGIRDDLAADIDEISCAVYAHRGAGLGIYCHYPGESDGSKQTRARRCVSGLLCGCHAWIGQTVVLDCSFCESGCAVGILHVLQKGAAIQAVSTRPNGLF